MWMEPTQRSYTLALPFHSVFDRIEIYVDSKHYCQHNMGVPYLPEEPPPAGTVIPPGYPVKAFHLHFGEIASETEAKQLIDGTSPAAVVGFLHRKNLPRPIVQYAFRRIRKFNEEHGDLNTGYGIPTNLAARLDAEGHRVPPSLIKGAVTPFEAAKILGVTTQAVVALIRRRGIEGIMLPNSQSYLIPRSIVTGLQIERSERAKLRERRGSS